MHPYNYVQVYNKLRSVLSAEELSLFAKPEVNPDFTSWLAAITGGVEVYALSAVSEAERDAVADILEELKAKVSKKISAVPDYAHMAASFFMVPGQGHIRVMRTERGRYLPLLTAWACQHIDAVSAVDPLSRFLQKPRVTTDVVDILVQYTNGNNAGNKFFFIDFLDHETREKTNDEGIFRRGRGKLGTSFTAYDKKGGERVWEKEFVVTQGGSYIYRVPLLVNCTVRITDQKDAPVPGAALLFTASDGEKEYQSDGSGAIKIEDAEAGTGLKVTEKDNEGNTKTYSITSEDPQEFVFTIKRPYTLSPVIKVVDKNNDLLPGYKLVHELTNTEMVANGAGEIKFNSIEEGTVIGLYNPQNMINRMQYLVNDEGPFMFRVEEPEVKMVKVRLVDHKRNPMKNIAIDFLYGGKVQSGITNEAGFCVLPYDGFTHGEKVKVRAHLSADARKYKN